MSLFGAAERFVAARHTPPATQAYTQAQPAVAQAGTRERHRAMAALHTAERLNEHTGQEPPGPFTSYPMAALHYQRARTLAVLGDHTAAGAPTTSLRTRAPEARRARALTTARLAEAQLRQGHLEQTIATWSQFLTDCPGLRSVRATSRPAAMRQAPRPHLTHPGAAELPQRAAAL